MQWMYDDTATYRKNLQTGLLIYLVCQTVVNIIYMIIAMALAATLKAPIGFAFPALTFEAFGYEILYFYFWSVSRRYADLCDVQTAEDNKGDKEMKPMGLN